MATTLSVKITTPQANAEVGDNVLVTGSVILKVGNDAWPINKLLGVTVQFGEERAGQASDAERRRLAVYGNSSK